VQPTDFVVWSVFVLPWSAEAARRNERGTGSGRQGLVAMERMKARLAGIILTLTSVLLIAVAGGASLKGW
jgi:hypothetical protein